MTRNGIGTPESTAAQLLLRWRYIILVYLITVTTVTYLLKPPSSAPGNNDTAVATQDLVEPSDPSYRISVLPDECLIDVRAKDRRDKKYSSRYNKSCKFLPPPIKVASSCPSQGLTKLIASFSNETNNLQRYVMFMATAHSGHSLVGGLLDSHPMMLVANECDIFSRFLESPKAQYPHTPLKTRKEIFDDIFSNSLKCALYSRLQHGYNYTVPNGFGGTWIKGELSVIGDKKGGSTSNRMHELLKISEDKMVRTFEKFQRTIGLPIHIIHAFWGKDSDVYKKNDEVIKILSKRLPSHLLSASEWDSDVYACGDDASRRSLLLDTCNNLKVPCNSDIISMWSSMATCKLALKHINGD